MSGPPTHITPTDLWAALTSTPRPYRTVDFPRTDPSTGQAIGEVAMWVLTPAEHSHCSGAAERYAKKVLGDAPRESIAFATVYDNAVAVEILMRAVRSATNVAAPFFPSADAIRETLTTDEVGALFAAYAQLQAELGPIVSRMTAEQLEAWLVRLEEGGRTLAPFYSLSPAAKNELLSFLVSHWWSSQKANNSPGTPAGEPTSEPSQEVDS